MTGTIANQYFKIHREPDGSVRIDLGTMSTNTLADAILDSREGSYRDLLMKIREDRTSDTIAYTQKIVTIVWNVSRTRNTYLDANVALGYGSEGVCEIGAAGRLVDRWVASARKARQRREQRGARVSEFVIGCGPECWVEALRSGKVREVINVATENGLTDADVITRRPTDPDTLVRVPAAAADAAE